VKVGVGWWFWLFAMEVIMSTRISTTPHEKQIAFQAIMLRELPQSVFATNIAVGYGDAHLPRTMDTDTASAKETARKVLRRGVDLLELARASASIVEAVDELEIRTIGEVGRRNDEVVRKAEAISHLDVLDVFGRMSGFIMQHRPTSPPTGDEVIVPPVLLGRLVPVIRFMVQTCPMSVVDAMIGIADEPELAHRFKTAIAAAQSFVRRHTDSEGKRIRVAGRAYEEGRLSLVELSGILGLPSSDAIFVLERNGFCRDATVIRLSDDERSQLLARLASTCTAAEPTAEKIRDLVPRLVVASQRIEGVDARPWITR
jgi:hypothetical protein